MTEYSAPKSTSRRLQHLPRADLAEIEAVPPHDIEAERSVLGACIVDPDMVPKVADLLIPDDFYRVAHARLYGIIGGLFLGGQGTSVIAIVAEAERVGVLEEIGGREYLATLARAVVNPADAHIHARIIRDKSLARAIVREAMEMRRAVLDNEAPTLALERVTRRLTNLAAAFTKAESKSWIWETDSTMESSRTDVEWILRGFIAKGAISLLVGQPKAGKSWLVYALLAAMERGDPEFIGYPLHARRAVVLSEEAPSTIRSKRQRFGGSDAYAAFLTRSSAFPPRPLRVVIEESVRKARETGADMIVVDTWAIWAHLAKDAEKDAGATQEALEPLLWAAGQGFAVLVVHHMKKADGEDGTSVRGSSALLGTIDILIELRRFGADAAEGPADGRSGKRALKTLGRYEECPEEVIVELEGDRFVSRGTARTARVASLADKVVEAVTNAAAPLTFNEVAGIVGVSTSGGRAKAGLHAAIRLATDARRIQTWTGDGSKWNPTRYAPPGVERAAPPPAKGS